MDSNSAGGFNIKVQNEYERVLANPANVIMSEGLEELLSPVQTDDITPGNILVVSTVAEKESRTEIPCSFRSIAKIGDSHRIELQFSDPMLLMRTISDLQDGFSISINDDLQLKIENCQLDGWDVFKDVDSFIVGLGVKGEIQF